MWIEYPDIIINRKNCFRSSHWENSNSLLKPSYQLKNLKISVIRTALPHFLSSLSASVRKWSDGIPSAPNEPEISSAVVSKWVASGTPTFEARGCSSGLLQKPARCNEDKFKSPFFFWNQTYLYKKEHVK